MRGIFSIVASIMLMFANFKQRFVRWLLADALPAPNDLPTPKLLHYEDLTDLSADERQDWISRLLDGVRVNSLAFGANTVRIGNPPSISSTLEGIAFDTDSGLTALGQIGMDISNGEPQWYGGTPSQQRSIFDTGGGPMLVATTPTGANEAASKSYVDGLIAGGTWLAPACVNGYQGTRTIAEINALTPASGDAVVAGDAGTPSAGASDALSAGDLAEFDGTNWKIIEPNSGGFPPDGTRALVSTTQTLYGPLTDGVDDGKIAEWDGTSLTPALITPATGNAVLINCDDTGGANSVNENKAYSFQGSVPTGSWVVFIGAIPNHVSLGGLSADTDGDLGHANMVMNTGRPTDGGQTIPGDTNAGGFLLLYGTSTAGYDSTGDIIAGSDFVPVTDSSVDVGETANRFANGFFDTMSVSANGGGGAGLTMNLGSDILADTTGSNIGAAGSPFGSIYGNVLYAENFLLGGDATTEDLVIGGNNSGVDNGSVILNAGTSDLYPSDDVTTGLGRAANRFTTVYANTFDAAVSIVPETDNVTTMGTASLRFADLHVFNPTHYGDMIMSGDQTYRPSGAASGQLGTDANHFREAHFGPNASSSPVGTDNALTLFGDVEVNGDYNLFPTNDNEGTIGIGAVAATAVLDGSSAAVFGGGDTVTLGSVTYTFTGSPSAEYDISPAGTIAEQWEDLRDAINGVANGNVYGASGLGTATTPNPDATASLNSPTNNILTATAITAGTAGNSIASTTTDGGGPVGQASWDNATLTGGVDATRWKQIIAVEVTAGDLSLRDQATGGQEAAWRLIEQPNKIVIINELTGKQFAMDMSPISESEYVDWPGFSRFAA